MLRYEASATDEKDASCLSMTATFSTVPLQKSGQIFYLPARNIMLMRLPDPLKDHQYPLPQRLNGASYR